MLRSSDNEEMVDLDIDPDSASRVGTLINERLDGELTVLSDSRHHLRLSTVGEEGFRLTLLPRSCPRSATVRLFLDRSTGQQLADELLRFWVSTLPHAN